MQVTITSPQSGTSVSRPITVTGTCDAIPSSPGRRVPVTNGPTITITYGDGAGSYTPATATCYSDQTWAATLPSTVGTASGNGSIAAACSDSHCPSNSVTGLTVS